MDSVKQVSGVEGELPGAEVHTGADLVHEALTALDVGVIFGLVSIHNLPILDVIRRRREIRFVTMRHEQAVVHAADAYARSTGRLGVALVSTGPGTANAVPGLYEANDASSPVLLVTTQVPSTEYGRSRGFSHEAEQQVPMLRSVVGHVSVARHADEIGDLILRTAIEILSGRPQPGAVQIPVDLQEASVTTPRLGPVGSVQRQHVGSYDLNRAVEAIENSDRRLIWAGGGVHRAGASRSLVALAEVLQAPVVTSRAGRGAIPDDHPLAVGSFSGIQPVGKIISEADLLIAVGTRFRTTDTGGLTHSLKLPNRIIHIDVDPKSMARFYPVEVELVGDATHVLDELASRLTGCSGDRGFLERAKVAREEAVSFVRSGMGDQAMEILDHLAAVIGRQTSIALDSNLASLGWGKMLIPVFEPRRVVHPVSLAIGPGLPMAIGATVATGRPTVSIIGDGGLMLHIGELATAVENQLPVVVCVFNNRGYGSLRAIQTQRYQANFAVDLTTPDFATVAEAMGCRAHRVSTSHEFGVAIRQAFESSGPTLLDIDVGSPPVELSR